MTKEELAKLTPEEKRIAIAEACGWSFVPDDGGKTHWLMQVYFKGEWKFQTSGGFGNFIPDYLNDLNAMAAAENCLATAQIESYLEHLTDQSGGDTPAGTASFCAYFATAEQRANAFLSVVCA